MEFVAKLIIISKKLCGGMMRLSRLMVVLCLFLLSLNPLLAHAGGGGSAPVKMDCSGNGVYPKAAAFLSQLGSGTMDIAYQSGHKLLRENRTLEQFADAMKQAEFSDYKSVEWTNCIKSKDGLRVDGTMTLKDNSATGITVYVIGTEKDNYASVQVLDVMNNRSVFSRISRGNSTTLDYTVLFGLGALMLTLLGMIVRYVVQLRGSPYELYLMFFTKLTEYSAYGAASMTLVLYLANDVGLGDSGGTAYYVVFSLIMTIVTMAVGAVCDTIGIKKSLLIGTLMLLTARLFMPLSVDIYVVSILGFLPMAIGTAFTGPVLKVGIKKFTTMKGAALGFGLFYTLMNIGFALGGWMFDALRAEYGDSGGTQVLGFNLSTYQVILGIGFFINIPDLIAVLLMRENVEMTEDGPIFIKEKVGKGERHRSEIA